MQEEILPILRKKLKFKDESIDKIKIFYKELLKANNSYNFISKSTIYNAWSRHILDSAQLVQYIKFDDGKSEKINTNIILSFFGLVMKLGPIAEWGLNMDKKTIEVNPQNFETNKKGIFAIGDICSYPGKLKLILSGFHEAALCSVECFKRARPNEKYRFEFTTASKSIQERLGKK